MQETGWLHAPTQAMQPRAMEDIWESFLMIC